MKMPEEVVNRLLAECSPWGTGASLERDKAAAIIRADRDEAKREQMEADCRALRATFGPHAGAYIAVIRQRFTEASDAPL